MSVRQPSPTDSVAAASPCAQVQVVRRLIKIIGGNDIIGDKGAVDRMVLEQLRDRIYALLLQDGHELIKIKPPLIISQNECDEVLDKFRKALTNVLRR